MSFAQTGDPANSKFTVVPVGTVVSFFDVFTLDETSTGGTLRIMSDDPTTVILNGTAICAERSHKGENDADCSDTEIAFKKAVSIHIAANLLHLGANTLEFRVEQRKGVGFGLDYTGTVNFMTPPYQGYILPYATSTKSPVTVPEPSSLAMLTAGIVVLLALVLLSTKKTAG
ncbi:MAG: PEP-CTERM sorting domain-containing protein [Candidatus Acidiferrales bacterium]